MDLRVTIREYARRTDPSGSTVTLTLELSKAGTPRATQVFLKDQVWPNLASEARNGGARGSLKKTARRMQAFLENELKPATDGLYLTAGPDSWSVLELRTPMRNFVTVNDGPYLPPLVELQSTAPRAYVVAMRGPDASISEAYLGTYTPLTLVELWTWARDVQKHQGAKAARSRASGASVGVTRQGGSRDRYDQKMDSEQRDVVRGAAEGVGHYHAVQPARSVYFAGRREDFEPFRKALPATLRDAATYAGPAPRDERGLSDRVLRELAAAAAGRRDAAAAEFQRRHREGHRVAVGPEDVLQHLRTGMLERVFLYQDDEVPGLACESCGTDFPGLAETCVWCKGRLRPVSLAQEFARRAVERPAFDVTFLPTSAKWLKDLGSVAALTLPRPRNG